MKYELEYGVAEKHLKKIFRQYGWCTLENPSRFHAFWADLAPGLKDEGKALDVFLALGLGNSVVELDEDRDSCMEWKQYAVKLLCDNGMEQNDAYSLVKMVMNALGLPTVPETNKNTSIEAESMILPIGELSTSIPKTDEKENQSEQVTVFEKVRQNAKNDVENSCNLLWHYMPQLCPNRYFVSPEPIPTEIMCALTRDIGLEKLNTLTILAFGYESTKNAFLLFAKDRMIYKKVQDKDKSHEIIYRDIQKISIVNGEMQILFKHNPQPIKVNCNWEEDNLSIAQLLCGLAGIHKPEIVVTDQMVFIKNVLCQCGVNAYIIINKQRALSDKKVKNILDSLCKENIFITAADINAFIDETIFGSCKEYIVFTDFEILAHSNTMKVERIRYSDMASVIEMPDKSSCKIIKRSGEEVVLKHYGGKQEKLGKAIRYIQSAYFMV